MYYHVRHANGVTVDWLESEFKAVELAASNQLQCFAVNPITGKATLIYNGSYMRSEHHE